MKGLGIVTTLGPSSHCFAQACVLGQILRKRFPETPRSAVGREDHLVGLDKHGWDLITSDDPALQRGFESKLEIYRYSPYEQTLFLDVDIIPVGSRPLAEIVRPLSTTQSPVSFFGQLRRENDDYQGTLMSDLADRGIKQMWATIAGGHYFWAQGSESRAVFERAKEIAAADWPEIFRFEPVLRDMAHAPDEVLVSIALAQLYPEAVLPSEPVFSAAANYAQKKHLSSEHCDFVHFWADSKPYLYYRLAVSQGVGKRDVTRATLEWSKKMTRKAFWRLLEKVRLQ